jgi:YesN/AraC family two-component response regulator
MYKSRILIVDDDEMILAALGFSFDLLLPGCQISTASDGAAALDELRRQPFDLILTDYSMPETNGLELAQAAHRISPDVRIVLMSGGLGRDEISAGATSIPLAGFLSKPFTLRQLGEILRKNEIFESAE